MTASTPTLAADEKLPTEERPEPGALADAAAYRALIERLSRQSVAKHYDAYLDIPWDDPAHALGEADPRWELTHDDPLGATAWYRALPQAERARTCGITYRASAP